MLSRISTHGWLSRAGLCGLGLAVALLTGPPARAQQDVNVVKPPVAPDVKPGDAKPAPADAARGTDAARKPTDTDQSAAVLDSLRKGIEANARSGQGERRPGHPALESLIKVARAEAEIVEAQIEAKKAQTRLVEARLKQARSRLDAIKKHAATGAVEDMRRAEAEGEVTVLEAELDAERAEIKEPQVLLKYARQNVEELEDLSRREAALMGMVGHPGMPMQSNPYMGLHPDPMHQMHLERFMSVDDRLMQLREAIMNLEEHVERLTSSQKGKDQATDGGAEKK